MRSSIHGPPSRSETRDAVDDRFEQAAQAERFARLLLQLGGGRRGHRADEGCDRAALDAHLDRELALVIVVGSLQHPVERELKVVEDVERDLVTCRDAADDQPDHGRERPLARN